jgi:hypothetical protein
VPPLPAPTGGLVSTEAHNTSTTTATITGGLIEVQRREGDLTDAFEAFLAAQGHQCQRFQLIVEGVGGSLKTDTYDVTDNVLYEAKGKSGREYVRMAIGQLLDYRRHAKQHVPAGLRLAVLLPEDPGQDLRDLIEGLGIALVFQDGDGFAGYPIA